MKLQCLTSVPGIKMQHFIILKKLKKKRLKVPWCSMIQNEKKLVAKMLELLESVWFTNFNMLWIWIKVLLIQTQESMEF